MKAGSQLHPGHALLALLALLAAFLGLRAWEAATAPLPTMPAMAPPLMTDFALLARFDPFFGTAGTMGDLPVTALPFSLHGLRLDAATGRGSAIIAVGDGQQAVYVVGDTLADGVTLASIALDHVELNRNGQREALWLDSSGAGAVSTYAPASPAMPATSQGAAPPPADAISEPAPQAVSGPEQK